MATLNRAKQDVNRTPTLIALSNAGDSTVVELWIDPTTHRLLVDTPGASGGTSSTDGATFTASTTSGTPMMAAYHSTIDAMADGTVGIVAMDSKRNLFTVIRDAAGNARGLNIDASGQLAVTIASSQTIAVTNAGTFAVQATLQTQTDTVMIGGVNIKEINAVTPLMGNGITGTGSLRVTVASDNTAFSVNATLQTQTDTVMVGGVNIKEINAVAPLMGNGATGTGSMRVTPANDSTGIANWGHGATAATVPSGATYAGRRATTALPTAVSDGQQVGSMADKYGRTVSIGGTIRDLIGTQTTTISASTTETTIVTAIASTFNDIKLIIVSNTSASTNSRIDFRDTTAGTVLFSLQSIGGAAPVGFNLGDSRIPQTTVNTNWTAQCATSTTDVRVYVVYEKNK